MRVTIFGLFISLFLSVSHAQEYSEVCGDVDKESINRQLGRLQLTPCKGLEVLPKALQSLVAKTSKIDKKSCFKLLMKLKKKSVVDKRDFVLWDPEEKKSLDLRCACKQVMGKASCPEKSKYEEGVESIREAYAYKAASVFIADSFKLLSDHVLSTTDKPFCAGKIRDISKNKACGPDSQAYLDKIFNKVLSNGKLVPLGEREGAVVKTGTGFNGFLESLDSFNESINNKNMTIIPVVQLPPTATDYLIKKYTPTSNEKVTYKEFSEQIYGDSGKIDKTLLEARSVITKAKGDPVRALVHSFLGESNLKNDEIADTFFTFNENDPTPIQELKIALMSHPATSDFFIKDGKSDSVSNSNYQRVRNKFELFVGELKKEENEFTDLYSLKQKFYEKDKSNSCEAFEKRVLSLCGLKAQRILDNVATKKPDEFILDIGELDLGGQELAEIKDKAQISYRDFKCMLQAYQPKSVNFVLEELVASEIKKSDLDAHTTSIPKIERQYREQIAKAEGLKELAAVAEKEGRLTPQKKKEIGILVTNYKLPGGEPFIVPANAKTITEKIAAYEEAVTEWATRRIKSRVDEIEEEVNRIANSDMPQEEKAKKLDALIDEMKKLDESGITERLAAKQREIRDFVDRFKQDKKAAEKMLTDKTKDKIKDDVGENQGTRKVANGSSGQAIDSNNTARPGSNFRSDFGFSPPIADKVGTSNNTTSGQGFVEKTQGAVLGRFVPRSEFDDEKTRQDLMVRYGELPIAVIDEKAEKFDIFSLEMEKGVPTYVKSGSLTFEEAEKKGYFLTKDIQDVLEGYGKEKGSRSIGSILEYSPDKASLMKKISILRKIQEFADAKEEISGVRVARTTLENLHRLLDNAIEN